MKKCIGVIIAIVVVVAILLAGSYNSLVSMEEDVKLARANVQTAMQRRLELIPDLAKTVEAYTKHEEKVFGDIAKARETLSNNIQNSEDAEALDETDKQISNLIDTAVKVVKEDYPELTSSQEYAQFMDQLEGSVNRLSVAREEYNAVVTKFNKKIRRFPGNIFASMYGFERFDTFEASEGADATNMVDFGEK